MRELPYLDELLDLLDIARANGYDKSLDEFKYDLLNRPEVIPFPPSAGPDFAGGGLVSLGYLLWEATLPKTEEQKLSRAD